MSDDPYERREENIHNEIHESKLNDEIESLRSQLALSQAREVDLSEALDEIKNLWDDNDLSTARSIAEQAISSSGSNTMERMKLMEKVVEAAGDLIEYQYGLARRLPSPGCHEFELIKDYKISLEALDELEKKETK